MDIVQLSAGVTGSLDDRADTEAIGAPGGPRAAQPARLLRFAADLIVRPQAAGKSSALARTHPTTTAFAAANTLAVDPAGGVRSYPRSLPAPISSSRQAGNRIPATASSCYRLPAANSCKPNRCFRSHRR